MSVGRAPDLSGNMTAVAFCVNCMGAPAQGDPERDSNYGGTAVTYGAAPPSCSVGGPITSNPSECGCGDAGGGHCTAPPRQYPDISNNPSFTQQGNWSSPF